MVSKWCQYVNRVLRNVDFAGFLKIVGSFITYIRTPLTSGIRFPISYRMFFKGIRWNCAVNDGTILLWKRLSQILRRPLFVSKVREG